MKESDSALAHGTSCFAWGGVDLLQWVQLQQRTECDVSPSEMLCSKNEQSKKTRSVWLFMMMLGLCCTKESRGAQVVLGSERQCWQCLWQQIVRIVVIPLLHSKTFSRLPITETNYQFHELEVRTWVTWFFELAMLLHSFAYLVMVHFFWGHSFQIIRVLLSSTIARFILCCGLWWDLSLFTFKCCAN
jgi:hypothetical protein